MLDKESANHLLGATVYDTDDNKIGGVGRVYLDDRSGQPAWVTVQTGMFGTKESFLPLGQARLDGDRLIVPIAKDAVKNAPHVDPDAGHLSVEEEQQLYQHYGLRHGDEEHDATPDGAAPTMVAPAPAAPPPAESEDSRSALDGPAPAVAAAGSADSPGAEQTAQSQSGLRLRRHMVTEEQQITVPVVREEYILEPDPDAAANRDQRSSEPPPQR